MPLPHTPVPGTLQTLSVLLAGSFLSGADAAASQSLYILMGLGGLPVFALPGAGPGYLLGPTGGYLIGFVLSAFAVGSLLHRKRTAGVAYSYLVFLLGGGIIHLCGLAWLSIVLGSTGAAFRAGVVPFVLFDAAKGIVACGIRAGYLRWNPTTLP